MNRHHPPHTRGPGSSYPPMQGTPHTYINHTTSHTSTTPASLPHSTPVSTYTHPASQAHLASQLHPVSYQTAAGTFPTLTSTVQRYTPPTTDWRQSQASQEAAKSENRKLFVFISIFGIWVLAWCIFIGYYVSMGT